MNVACAAEKSKRMVRGESGMDCHRESTSEKNGIYLTVTVEAALLMGG